MTRSFLFLSAILFLSCRACGAWAAEDKGEEIASQTFAGLNQQAKAELEKTVRKTDPAVIDQTAFEKNDQEPLAMAEENEAPALSDEGTELSADSPSVPAEEKSPAAAFEAPAASPVPVKTSTPDIKTSVMEKNWDALFSEKMTPSVTVYTIQPGDSLYVIAAKNRTTIDLIKKMNGLKSDNIYAGKKLRIYKGAFSVLVDKSENVLILFADGKPIRRYHVSTGKNNSTPAGEFKIVNKITNPTWFKTGAIYPPGSPDNVLGTRWLGFDKPEYGIHGTVEPDKIGRSVSEGCVRMRNAEVEEIYSMVPAGTAVTIQE